MPRLSLFAAVAVLATNAGACAQLNCHPGLFQAAGQVLDPSGAVVAGAEVAVDGKAAVRTDRRGKFTTGCLSAGLHRFTVLAPTFEPITLLSDAGAPPMLFRLHPTDVAVTVDVSGADDPLSGGDIAGSKTLQASDLKQLADDPDEFARQLQVLAAAAGGSPGQAVVTVDGFQNAGQIPPKSSIAYIRVNPDLFSAEYEHPPYEGGRIEIYTKPGQQKFHGALFTTQSAQFMNAKDPFSTSKAAIGRQRYGFELSGPLKANKADISLNLEHRQISNFAVVNAVTLAGTVPVATVYNVATPQSLYQGSVRLGLLPTKNNNLTLTYQANVNTLGNVGVGGTTLLEAGFTSGTSDHTLRLSNLQTISPALLHETHLSYEWDYATDAPNSFLPSLVVAGSFTGGGASVGAMQQHRRDVEFDDDVIFSHGKHNLKAGVQVLDILYHDSLPTNFNGQYTFGGCSAAVLSCAGLNVTPLEQYQLALAGQAGGTPTTYAVTTGTAQVFVNQLRVSPFLQDQYRVNSHLALTGGLRWALQSAPATVGNFAPRFGLSYAPDKKQRLVLHLRVGLFNDFIRSARPLENRRLDGAHERQLLTYSPVYNGIAAPTTGSATITTLRTPFDHLNMGDALEGHAGLEYEAPRHFHLQGNVYLVHSWNDLRSENINAPIPTGGVASPTGLRPFSAAGLANTNLFQFQQSAKTRGLVTFFGLDQHSLKRLQVFIGYVRLDLRSDTDDGTTFPQSSYSDVGEFSRSTGQPTHQVFSFATYHLPYKADLSMQFNAASGAPYNVTSGFDTNGDGVLNDRPAYATAADLAAAQAGTETVYATRFGNLVSAGAGTPLGRNAATLPWNVHLDMNLSRTFPLSHRADGQTLALNLRSTNLLNHTNVTAAGGVLGSSFFLTPYAADAGRRVEVGARYAF